MTFAFAAPLEADAAAGAAGTGSAATPIEAVNRARVKVTDSRRIMLIPSGLSIIVGTLRTNRVSELFKDCTIQPARSFPAAAIAVAQVELAAFS